MRKTWHAYILIAPLVAGCLLFTVVPFVLVLRYSFMRGSGRTAQFLGPENYMKVVGNEEFMLAFGNSMKFLVVGLPLIMFRSYIIDLSSRQSVSFGYLYSCSRISRHRIPCSFALIIAAINAFKCCGFGQYRSAGRFLKLFRRLSYVHYFWERSIV